MCENIAEDTRTKIILSSIELLRSEGLKFSVDSLAGVMKISKKTIYKYFATKEELAIALFEHVFDELQREIDSVIPVQILDFIALAKMLNILDETLYFCDENIFNRYSLNEHIKDFAYSRAESVWRSFTGILRDSAYSSLTKEASLYKTISSALKSFRGEVNHDELLESFIYVVFGKRK